MTTRGLFRRLSVTSSQVTKYRLVLIREMASIGSSNAGRPTNWLNPSSDTGASDERLFFGIFLIEERLKNKLGQSLRHPDQFVDPSGINKEYAGMTKFRMSDGDGKVYYVGWIDGEYDLTEPLDDFGTPNAGAIYLSTLKADGSWSGTEVEAE